MTLRCPSCGASLGGDAPQGGLRVSGLAIVLVKANGQVSGPCKRCRAEVEIVGDGKLAKAVDAAMPRPATRRARVVFVVSDE